MAEKLNIGEGTKVEIKPEHHGIVIKPTKEKEETLEELVAKITPKNRHEKIDWGKPRGKEIW